MSTSNIHPPRVRRQVLYVPRNLDFTEKFPVRPELTVYRQWVVSTLYLYRWMRWDGGRVTYGAPLHSAVLRDILPRRHAAAIVAELIAAGILVRVRNHRAGTSARQYRLAPEYESAPYVTVPLTHPELLAKLARHRERLDAPHWEAMRSWLDRLDIDPTHTADNLPLAVLQTNPLQWFVEDQNGRLHTPLTALDRVYRRFVTVAGKRLVQADVSHCQPLLLAALLVGRNGASRNGAGAADGTTGKTGEGERKRETFYVVTLSDAGLNDELADYVRLCAEAKLYDVLAELTGQSRDRAKKQLLAALYDRPHNLFRYRAGRAFAARFPLIWAAVEAIHREGRGRLARELQRLESDIVVRLSAGRLADEFPDLPCYTIHDCVLTTPDGAGTAAAVLRDEFRKRTGIEPTVKVSEWATDEVPKTRRAKKTYLVAYVRSHQGETGCVLTGQQVADMLGLESRQSGTRLLAEVAEEGRLAVVTKGRGRRPGVYRAGGTVTNGAAAANGAARNGAGAGLNDSAPVPPAEVTVPAPPPERRTSGPLSPPGRPDPLAPYRPTEVRPLIPVPVSAGPPRNRFRRILAC